MGCKVDCLTMDETIHLVEEIIREGRPRQHVVVNALKFAMMRSDSELRRIINACDVVNADGMPVVWASKVLGKPLPDRVAGVDLFLKLIETAAKKDYRPYFLGARESVSAEDSVRIQRKIPSNRYRRIPERLFQT